MSQVTVITTTLPVIVVSSASSTTATVTIILTDMGLAAALCQHDVFLPAPLVPRDTIKGYCCLLHYATAVTSVPDGFLGLCQICHESSSAEPPQI